MSHYGPSSPYPGQPGPQQGGSYGWNPQGGYQGSSQYPQAGGYPPYVPVTQSGTLPLRPLTLGDYFSSMFATLRKSPGLFFGAALIFGSIAAIVAATGEFFLTRAFGASLTDPYAQFDQLFSGAMMGFVGSMMLSQLILIVGQTFNWGMYSVMVARGSVGMKTSLGQGFRLLRGQWGRLIGLLALMIVAILVLYLVMILLALLVFGILFAGGEPESGAAIALGILGILAAIFVPLLVGAYFGIRWYLVIPAMVIEDIGIFAGLRRSWHLTRGYFWRTLGIALLFGLILLIVSTIITSPLAFISGFILASAGTEGQLMTSMLLVNLVITAVSSLAGFIVTNMGLLISIFFYFDYRFRKEGLGLEFQHIAAHHAAGSPTDRFDTSLEEQPASNDEANDLIPGRHTVGLQPGPYGQQPGHQPPPNPPGPYG